MEPVEASTFFLPGILGSTLRSPLGELRWLAPADVALGRLPARLGLDTAPDLYADGVLDVAYGAWVTALRAAGPVATVPYDWRRSIDESALELARVVGAARRPVLRLVAHSMGCLVALVAAARFPELFARVDRAVLVAPPLGGSFAAVQALLGGGPVIDSLTLGLRDPAPLQRMVAGFPGLLELLPDPAVFGAAAALDLASPWPSAVGAPPFDGAGLARLRADWRRSPLWSRAHLLLGTTTCTAGPLSGPENGLLRLLDVDEGGLPGDGTVPAASAWPGADSPARRGDWQVCSVHFLQPVDPTVWAASLRLLRADDCGLARFTGEDAAGLPTGPEAAPADTCPMEARRSLGQQLDLARRWRAGEARAEDWALLHGTLPPAGGGAAPTPVA